LTAFAQLQSHRITNEFEEARLAALSVGALVAFVHKLGALLDGAEFFLVYLVGQLVVRRVGEMGGLGLVTFAHKEAPERLSIIICGTCTATIYVERMIRCWHAGFNCAVLAAVRTDFFISW